MVLPIVVLLVLICIFVWAVFGFLSEGQKFFDGFERRHNETLDEIRLCRERTD